MFRFLADIVWDAAVTIDILSPFVESLAPTTLARPARILALSFSSALYALTGVIAGGSKSALRIHFATSMCRNGDIGELTAKEGSTDTLAAMSGMLVRYQFKRVPGTAELE